MNLKILSLLIIYFCFCSCSEFKNENSFFDKENQDLSNRIVKSDLRLVNNFKLYDNYGITSASSLMLYGNSLLITDSSQNKICKISTNSFEIETCFSIPEGQGPKEIRSMFPFAFHEKTIAVVDNSQSKIQYRSDNGEFIAEYSLSNLQPERILYKDSYSLITLSDPFFSGKEFLLHEINESGDLIAAFGRIDEEKFNTLKYPGNINIDSGGNIYYAGFSEHILKKWDSNYNLKFSISSIDNFPSELNYVTNTNSESQIMGYSEFGVFSSIGSSLFKKYWLILHGGVSGDNDELPKLDIYSVESGEYLFTFELPYRSNGPIVVDDNYIFLIQFIDDELSLVIYENEIS